MESTINCSVCENTCLLENITRCGQTHQFCPTCMLTHIKKKGNFCPICFKGPIIRNFPSDNNSIFYEMRNEIDRLEGEASRINAVAEDKAGQLAREKIKGEKLTEKISELKALVEKYKKK